MVIPDLFNLPDGALIKTSEVWSTKKRRGFMPDSKCTFMRKLEDGRLPKPDLDHGPGSRYYLAGTLKGTLQPQGGRVAG